MRRTLRIGTRGSRLALAQAQWVREQIVAGGIVEEAELVVIRTSGDRFGSQRLSAIGGKGLFVKEIEEALIEGAVDLAVHSLKDLPAEIPAGLVLAAVPRREDPRDALLCRADGGLGALAQGACIGTSSLRRAALLKELRSDFRIEALRGNVDTRLRKLEAGELDGIVLAAAGLRRLGIVWPHSTLLPPETFVPAIGQGALAIEACEGDLAAELMAIDDAESHHAIRAERAFLTAVGGSCVTPLAAHATLSHDWVLELRAVIAAPGGGHSVRGKRTGLPADAERIGAELARELLAGGGAAILEALKETP